MAFVLDNTAQSRFVLDESPRFVLDDEVDTSDIEPLPEADVSTTPLKAVGAIAGGMQAFPISGLAGIGAGVIEPSKDRSLDIPGEPDVGGGIGWDLERAGKAVEAVGSIPAKIADDKASQELTGELMKPVEMVEHAGQFYGDWVEKNWPDKDEAADMGALTKSVFEGAVFVGLPVLKAKLIKAIKAKDIPKIKETLERVSIEKPPEEMAKNPESVFLKEEFEKRFVLDEEPVVPEKALGAKPVEAVKIYRRGRKDGRWWTSEKDYADIFGEDRKLQSKEIDTGNLNILDSRTDEGKFLNNLSEKEMDKALAERGYDGFLGEGEKGEPIYYFPKEKAKPPEVAKAKAEADEYFYVKSGSKSIEVIKNPTHKDYQALSKEVRKDFPDMPKGEPKTRITYDAEGNKYAWRADKGTHPEVEPLINKKYDTITNQNEYMLPPKSSGETLYSGIPIHKAGEAYTKLVGEPLWDNLAMQKIPELLEKVPGGKALNRAFIYDYRGDLKDTAKFIKSMEDKKRHQAIGREYGIDLGKRLQSVPEQSQLKMGEVIRGEDVKLTATESALADEAMWSMLELGKQSVDLGFISQETFFKNAGRYMPRLYTSKEYQSMLTQFNITKPNRLDLSRFKRRKDIPKEIRAEMGEILTPGYPIAKGITQLTHDIEVARFFNGIAENTDWSLPKKSEVPIPDGWKQLPSNEKLGRLSKSYVHPEIFADIQETIHVMKQGEKYWRKALGAWKFGKVIISPKTHVRNLMSNSVLAHLGGLPMYEQPIYLTKAALEMKSKGGYWKAMREEGGGQHTFTVGELGALFDQVESQMQGLKAGGLPEKFGIIGNAWGKGKSAMRKAADLYQAEEQWFKMAKFIHNIERKKMIPKQAWADAEKWLFDYSKVTKFQDKYRTKWYGAPFATFTFKALPRMAEAMVKTPWRFALPAAMIYGLEKAAQRKIGDTSEEIKAKKALRPEWMQGSFLGIPNFARVPFLDEEGREYWLNLTYTLPWGDIGEQGKFGPIPGGLMPFSMPFAKEGWQQAAGYDSFWKEEIVPETELAGKSKVDQLKTKAKLRGAHAAKTMLPAPVFDVVKIVDALRDMPDYRGRTRPSKIAAADVIAGIKMYPVDYTEQVMKKIGKIHPNTGYLARRILGQIRTLAIKKQSAQKRGKDTKYYDEQIKEKVDQLKGLGEKSKEVGELLKKSDGRVK